MDGRIDRWKKGRKKWREGWEKGKKREKDEKWK